MTKQKKVLLIVGNDKIGRKLLANLNVNDSIVIYLDKSSSLKRVIKLIKRGSLSIWLIVKMFWADLLRKNYPSPDLPAIYKNGDLIKVMSEIENLDKVYLFRAGLIISKKTLAAFPRIYNVHCGRLPDYGGLGIIQRALNDRAYDQCATLYQVTVSIDDGEIFDTEPYRLDPKRSYKYNEDSAYDAGIKLFGRILNS